MRWEEAEIWIAPIDTWVKTRAQAEPDPEGQWHKTQQVYNKAMELAAEIWLDNEMEEEAAKIDVDLDLTKKEGTANEQESKTERVSDMRPTPVVQGDAEDDSAGGSPELPPESASTVSTADETGAD